MSQIARQFKRRRWPGRAPEAGARARKEAGTHGYREDHRRGLGVIAEVAGRLPMPRSGVAPWRARPLEQPARRARLRGSASRAPRGAQLASKRSTGRFRIAVALDGAILN